MEVKAIILIIVVALVIGICVYRNLPSVKARANAKSVKNKKD